MYATSRRQFLQRATSAAAFVAMARPDIAARVADASRAVAGRTPEDIAADEDFWRQMQEAFTLDRTLINLNNGGVCPSPRAVHEAMKRYLDISNQAPAYHMWQVLEPNIESVRERLASEFGCDTEELAITRNASEALQIAQLGLDLAPGDEVVTTNQDYGRMLDTWQQRVRRDGIVLKQVSFPVPPPSQADLAQAARGRDHSADEGAALLPHHEPHGTDLPGGRHLPHGPRARHHDHRRRRACVRALPVHARATSSATTTARACTSGCSRRSGRAFSTCAASASRSTGRSRQPRNRRQGTSASSRRSARIRRPCTTRSPKPSSSTRRSAPIGRSRGCGICASAGRRPFNARPGAKVLTSFDPAQSARSGCSRSTGVDPNALVTFLWNKHRIIATPIKHAEFQGLRVTPNVYTTLDDVDRFMSAIDEVLAHGVPTA